MQANVQTKPQPVFIDQVNLAARCKKNVQFLTGDTQGLFLSPTQEQYLPLEELLRTELKNQYTLLSLDSLGLSFDGPGLAETAKICADMKREKDWSEQIAELASRAIRPAHDEFLQQVAETKFMPLAAMELLKKIFRRFDEVRAKAPASTKPLCVLVRHAGALFPEKEIGSLDQQDRARLVFFLNWVAEPSFSSGENIMLLLESTRAEINRRVTSLINAEHIQIALPGPAERAAFIDFMMKKKGASPADLEMPVDQLVASTAGLPLANLRDLLTVAKAKQNKVTRQAVVEAVNEALRGMLGEVVTFKSKDHGVADVLGFTAAKQTLTDVFADCEDPETAIPAILVSGANGVGKTWLMEGFAFDSGWTVIELSGLRDKMFGGTEKFFELFRMVVSTFGRILVEMDEAHTALGSVHDQDTHEVEKRLAGNIYKLMGNPSYHGKILWVLMTSRPDELDPDIKSRCPIQIPLFDFEPAERRDFLSQLLQRKKITILPEELEEIASKSKTFSNRDYNFMVKLYIGRKKRQPELTLSQFLNGWRATNSIRLEREYQELVAAQHCTFPELLPNRIANVEERDRSKRIHELSWSIEK